MRFLLFIPILTVLLSASPPAFGQTAPDGWSELTTAEKAEIAVLVAQKAEKQVITPVTAEEVEPWLKLIDHLGTGLVTLAHNLGVEANELLMSPVGAVVVGLVGYHVMGEELMGFFAGLTFFSLALPIWLLFFYKTVIPVKEYREVTLARSFGRAPVTVQVPVRRKPNWEDDNGPEWVATIGIALIFLVTIIFIA